jgi:hypothetical protein
MITADCFLIVASAFSYCFTGFNTTLDGTYGTHIGTVLVLNCVLLIAVLVFLSSLTVKFQIWCMYW